MGKGKRTQINNEQKQSEKLILKQQENDENKRRRKKAAIFTSAAVLFFAVLIALSVLYTVFTNNGWFARRKTVVKSANYSVNLSMAQYFFNTAVDNFSAENSEYAEQLGFDTDTDLKKQKYPYTDADYESWYDYFADSTKSRLEELVTLCEAAKSEGIKLEKSDENYIEKTIKGLESTAEQNSQTVKEYLTENYGSIVNEEDVRRCLEITQLASKYYTKYSSLLSYGDEQINSYFNENKSTFLQCEYIKYSFSSSQKNTAANIAAAKNYDEFSSRLKAYIKTSLKNEKSGNELTDAVNEEFDNASFTDSYDVSTSEGEWLFSENRKSGDTTVIKTDSGYDVYYIQSPAVKDTLETKNVRHILVSSGDDKEAAKKQAKTLLKEWRNGDKTEQSFAELAALNTDDSGSLLSGGLYENVKQGQMVTSFNDWLFDSSRKSGDTDIVESDYGYHVMYFVGNGTAAWKADVISTMKSDDYSKKLSDLKEKYETKTVDGNLAKIEQVYDKTADTSSDSSLTDDSAN